MIIKGITKDSTVCVQRKLEETDTGRKTVGTMKSDMTQIPIAGYAIPADKCPYPLQESITTIAPPSYESTINPENDQGSGC